DQLLVLGRAGKLSNLTAKCTAKGGAVMGFVMGGVMGALAAGHGSDHYTVTAMGPRGWNAQHVLEMTRGGATVTRQAILPDWRGAVVPAVGRRSEEVFERGREEIGSRAQWPFALEHSVRSSLRHWSPPSSQGSPITPINKTAPPWQPSRAAR